MKILMLMPFPGVRGPVSKHTPLLVEALRLLGCTVETEPWGRHTDPDSVIERAITRIRDVARIRRRLREERFDLMVVKTSHEWPSLIRDVALLAATRTSVPCIVLQFHGGRSDCLVAPRRVAFKTATAAVFGLSDGVLVLSSEEKRLSQTFWPSGQFHVVANPFVAETSDVPDHQPEGGAPALLFASRLIAEKGIFETLAAVDILRRRLPCRLVVAGSGPQEGAVAQCVRDLRIEREVTLAGFLAGDKLIRAYRSASVFVLPTYWFEGFPTAISEAMAAGLPIVTTRTRGIADHLDDGVNAIFVPPRDAAAIADAVETLARDTELRMRMSAANRAKVRMFAPEAVARDYLAALGAIVSSKSSSATTVSP
jgi:glycosyltransferase involved in cell wall biosynthesis